MSRYLDRVGSGANPLHAVGPREARYPDAKQWRHDTGRALRPAPDRAKVAGPLGGAGHLAGPEPWRGRLRPSPPKELCARDAALPVRRAAHGPPQELHD